MGTLADRIMGLSDAAAVEACKNLKLGTAIRAAAAFR